MRDHPPAPATLGLGVPPALSDLVMELLAKKPEGRPLSAQVVVERLQQIGVDPTLLLSPSGRSEPGQGRGWERELRQPAARGAGCWEQWWAR